MPTMKPGRLSSLALLLALFGAGSALAQQHPGQRQGRAAQQQQPQQAARPVMPPTGGARDASWRGNRQQPQQGRMSDEERQQLRRDISDHGRDIYQDRGARR